MRPGRLVAVGSLLVIGGLNERVTEVFRPTPPEFCETTCSNDDCFVTTTLENIAVNGKFRIYVRATQSIVKEEVKGRKWGTKLVRRLGCNKVPGYPNFPDEGDLDRSEQFKTPNAVDLTGEVANDHVTIDLDAREPVSASIARTELHGIGIRGETFVNDKLVVTSDEAEH